jgi:hypothetical protein
MNSKEFTDYEELMQFAESLIGEKKWAVDIRQISDDLYTIYWIEHKTFKAFDGREFYDEIWTTAEGKIICVQDMDVEHVRNALRRVLRQDRETREILESALQQVAQAEDTGDQADETGALWPNPLTRTLH